MSVFENKFTKKPVTMDGSGGPLRGLFGSFRICGSKRARWENFEGWATIKQLIKNVKCKIYGNLLIFQSPMFWHKSYNWGYREFVHFDGNKTDNKFMARILCTKK